MKPKVRYLGLVWYKALAELNVEMERAYVGFLWWILEPVLYMAAFYVGFGLGLRGGGEHVAVFMLCALVPWKWFASTITGSSISLQVNSGLLQQVYLPKTILPFFILGANTIKFLLVFALLVIFLVLMGHTPGLFWLALPVIIAIEFLLIAALASLTAAIVPLVPDLKLVVDNGLMILMFVSGVFFDIDRLPYAAARILKLNPMASIIESYRAVLLHQNWPNWTGLGWSLLCALVMYGIAYYILRVNDRKYVKLMTT